MSGGWTPIATAPTNRIVEVAHWVMVPAPLGKDDWQLCWIEAGNRSTDGATHWRELGKPEK